MKAKDSDIAELVSGDRTFQIPIFQRHYDWDEEKWNTLHNDLKYSVSGMIDKRPPHFIGTIVTSNPQVDAVSDPIFTIIDGQQ